MTRVRVDVGLLVALAIGLVAAPASAMPEPSAPSPATLEPTVGLASALALPLVTAEGTSASGTWLAAKQKDAAGTPAAHEGPTLNPERAQAIMRSLTVPGWGQAVQGHRTAATVFAVAEIGIWVSYFAFTAQEQMRTDAFQRTAQVQAGINLRGRDEEFQRIVGSYISSDEYNHLVVYRDAANQFYDEHGNLVDPVGFQNYVNEHSLKGLDTWSWPSDESLLRYRGQRKDAQRAGLRSDTALGLAIVNRLISALHAARMTPAKSARSWELRTLPDEGDPTALRVGVRTRF